MNLFKFPKKIFYIVFLGFLIFLSINPKFSQAEDLKLPEPIDYVSDYANLISEQTESEINEQLRDFDKQTGTQVVVVTINNFQNTTIEDFAVRLFEKWGIGQKEKDNGILLLFRPNEGSGSHVRIEVGYGLEGFIPDSVAGRILDDYFMPYYNENDYNSAVKNTTTELVNILKNGVPENYYEEKGEDSPLWSMLTMVFFLIIVGSRSWWLGGVAGFALGAYLGWQTDRLIGALILGILMGLGGTLVDFILSRRSLYSRSGYSSGSFSSGGFSSGGGFSGGGGSSGGGGASR